MKGDRLTLGLLIGVMSLLGWNEGAIAQLIPDQTLGSNTSIVSPLSPTIDRIDGGVTRGINLFHSFREFNIGEGRSAYFVLQDPALKNVFARVTGSNRSEILGVLGVSGGNANLFLINPNGILFGPNSSLDVGGSFAVTTANAIEFGDRGSFSATNPVNPSPLLRVDPSAFLFTQINPAPIENRSRADAGRDPSNSFNTFGLRVPDGRSLLMLGGDINTNGGGIVAFGGRIDIGGLAGTGSVGLSMAANDLRLSFPESVTRADIFHRNDAGFIVKAGGGGNVALTGRNIEISSGGSIDAGILSGLNTRNDRAGDITINATNTITVTGKGSYVSNDINSNATGNGGNVNIFTKRLSIRDGADVTSDNKGIGQGGSVIIQASELVEVLGVASSDFLDLSWLRANVSGGESSRGGNVIINTNQLIVKNGAQISVSAFSDGGIAGNLNVNATQSVELSGTSPGSEIKDVYPSGLFAVINQAKGQSGNIFLETKRLSISDGSKLQVTTFGDGNAGNLFIRADEINIFESGTPHFYNTTINTDVSFDPRSVTPPKGNGGNLTIETNQLKIYGGSISADTYGEGNAGRLLIKARDFVEIVDTFAETGWTSSMSVRVRPGARGNGGNLVLETKRLSILSKDSIASISGSVAGAGRAGDITLRASDEIQIAGTGGLFAQVNPQGTGNGGNLIIETGRLTIQDGGLISLNTLGVGNAGNLFVRAKESIDVVGASTDGTRSSLRAEVDQGATGTGGNIILETGRLNVRAGGQVSVRTTGTGDAGTLRILVDDLTEVAGVSSDGQFKSTISAAAREGSTGFGGSLNLETGQLNIRDGGVITSSSEGQKPAGNINIVVRETLEANNGDISTRSIQSGGGNMNITASNIFLRGDSNITTDSGVGNGGNITLTADSIVALNDSDILAFARDGKGGNITLNTKAFFGQNYRPAPLGTDPRTLDGNDRVDINASGTISGIISLPDVSFIQNGLNQLPKSAIDTEKLVSQTCIVRKDKPQGTFYILGKTNLPQRPGDLIPSNYSTQEPTTQTANKSWQKGDPIVEPTGFYKLANGRLVMSRECDR